MSTSWATAFFVATITVLLTTPSFRQLAWTVGLLDKPAASKSHSVPVPYLGGMAIALGVLAGIAFAPGGSRFGALALIAAGVCAVGLFDDDRFLLPRTRLSAEMIAAMATVALGLRFRMTGVGVVDGVITVVWIVGLINAMNFLDNMDGLSAGVASSIAGSSLFLMLGGDGFAAAAALAAAVVGACLGFLAYNKRPASVYMGDAGSLFLGYLLAVITLEATQPLSSGSRFIVPLMLAAVPLADTTTVVATRLRRGISPAHAGKDHLSHRLVRRGLSPGPAVGVLVAATLMVALLGSFAGRGDLPLPVAAVVGAFVLGLVLAAALPAQVYDEALIRLPGRPRVLTAVAISGCAIVVAGGVFVSSTARGPIVSGGGRTTERAVMTMGKNLEDRGWALGLTFGGIAGLGGVLHGIVRQRRRVLQPGHAQSLAVRVAMPAVGACELLAGKDDMDARVSQKRQESGGAGRVPSQRSTAS